ncbi:MAG: NAD(P)-dependent oxidoreductase [Melioribacteraceae bacterium]|nr:NAD(P)-dependent oxidoreductase [Melioribacteraceae bacterium]MCF8353410.1 NAD(P)-dependent oxidoreductase [Melioribacteraceae bacterium]MCF8396377.1 NAD(P)-dependent oxidoreductase [Melioribacteraceae bacterium]MCF8418971.1 NAD(P)-dependent oxidoreductase [Melioribacteraceae bacterium]
MNEKKISVVTGANGFVGSHLADYLLEQGHEVRCLIRKTSDRKWLKDKPFKIYDCGLFDKVGMKEVLKDANYLFHVAGVVKAKTEEEYYNGNVKTTENLLHVLAEVNPGINRIVIVSSQTACGPSPSEHEPCNEETVPHPITRYGKSKYEQERLALNFKDKLPISIVRPPAIFGERDTEIYLVFKTYKAGLMTLIGFDEKKVNLVHVADLVEGIYLTAITDKAEGQIYFIGSENSYTWGEVAEQMHKSIGKKAINLRLPHSLVYTVAGIAQFFAMFSSKAATFNIEKARDFVQSFWTIDVSKAKQDLGYTQKVSLEEGIKRTVDWYREMKWL